MTEVSLCRSVASLPPTARDRKPIQVQCCTHPQTAREQLSSGRFQPCCFDPGNSHSRARWPLLAIPDAPPACFRHWRRQAPVPLGARDGKPSQVQCCTWLNTAREQLSPGRFPSRSLPPGNSHSRVPWPLLAIPDAPPRCVAHRARSASVPPAARDGKPSQVQCMHSPADGPKAALSRAFPIALSSATGGAR